MPPFAVDPGIDVVEHPVENAEVDALDHAHVIEIDVDAVLLHGFELAPLVSGEAEGDEGYGKGKPLDDAALSRKQRNLSLLCALSARLLARIVALSPTYNGKRPLTH